MPTFSPEQDAALKAVADWLKAKPGGRAPIFRLFGYAGTGKTTLAKHIAEGVDGKVLFAAFTGKAAHGDAQQGLPRRLHHPQPDLPAAREQRRDAELRAVGRRAGLEGQADRHRRVLDGRRRSRARSEILRRAAPGARRSRATAADPGRRLLHRAPSPTPCSPKCTGRRRTIRSSAVDGHPRRPAAGARHLRRDAGGDARRSRPAARARRRPGAGRPQRHPPRLQSRACAQRRGFDGRAAGRRRQARLPAQQPAQGPVQRRALD